MKKIILVAAIPFVMLACHQKKEPAVVSSTTPSQPVTEVAVPDHDTASGAFSETALSQPVHPSDTFVRDPNAPLGSPQNPIVLDADQPLDLSALIANQGLNTVSERFASRLDSIRKGAESGNPDLMYQYGACFEQGWGVKQDFDQAYTWYKKAADQGQQNAYGALGGLYRLGHGVPLDPQQSFQWFQKGAERNDPNSMLCLGNCYYSGLGTAKDLAKAAQWWDKAAQMGNGFACSQMGDAYYGGLGVEKDLAKAVECYQKAVAKNVPNALYRLGVLAYYGDGIAKDEAYAKTLLTKASDSNVPQAKEFLEKHFNQ